ncbi:MAG: hypothetical protein V4473_00960 [Patescibacteria group bacterium]
MKFSKKFKITQLTRSASDEISEKGGRYDIVAQDEAFQYYGGQIALSGTFDAYKKNGIEWDINNLYKTLEIEVELLNDGDVADLNGLRMGSMQKIRSTTNTELSTSIMIYLQDNHQYEIESKELAINISLKVTDAEFLELEKYTKQPFFKFNILQIV